MRLNGWTRIMVVMSTAWIILIGGAAYLDYPKTLQDRSPYWLSYKNHFDVFDVPAVPVESAAPGLFDDLIPPGRVDPNWRVFLIRGALPIILLWLLYGSVVWVRRGFIGADRA